MSVRATGGDVAVVNDFTDFDQVDPRITVLADGGWVVTYAAEGTDGAGYGIFQQRFDAAANQVGPEFLVNTNVVGDQTNPVVTSLPDGGWVVCWTDGTGIFQQRFDVFGERTGGEELVNALTGQLGVPSITTLADGGWAITFSSNAADLGNPGISVVRFTPDGVNQGEAFITLGSSEIHVLPAIAGLGDGGWLVTWTVEDGAEFDVLQQRFDATGLELGFPEVVNTFTANDQGNPAVAALADGGWVVVWESGGQDATLRTIYQQQYDAYGSPVGGEVRVSPAAMQAEEHPDVTALADGGWIVSWEEGDANGLGLYQQRFDARGNPVGSATLINVTQTGTQQSAALAALPDGSWLTVWVDNETFSNANIHQRVFAPDVAGGSGADTLAGTRWNETLIGNAGNDTLGGGGGEDLMIGGSGNDLYFVDSAGDRVRELSNQGTDTVSASLTYALGTAAVENLVLAGAATINGTGNALDNAVTGNGAANTLMGDAGNDILDGGAGNDALGGGIGNDVLIGGAGNDTLNGGSGRDTASYRAASGGVTVSIAAAGAQATGGAGSDTLLSVENLAGSNFADTLTGNASDNIIEGGDGNDILTGGGGSDTASYAESASGVTVNFSLGGPQFTVGAGTDTLSGFVNLLGSAFADTLTGDLADNFIDGGAGNDVLNGGDGSDTASYASAVAGVTVSLANLAQQNTIGAGRDTLSGFENLLGSVFGDTLIGGAGGNYLNGGLGNDLLRGNNGRDRLEGGRGADILNGGSGADRYIFDDGDSGGNSSAVTDLIEGFSQAQGDVIDLSRVDTDALIGGDQAFTFIGDAAFSGAAGELRFEVGGDVTFVFGDLNGDTFVDFAIMLDTQVFLTAADFAL